MIQTFFEQHYYLIGLISFLLGLILMPIVIRIAKAKGFVVRPNKRMSHEGEVPNIGGLNICISFILTYLLFQLSDERSNGLVQSEIGVFLFLLTICHGLMVERPSIISQAEQIGDIVGTESFLTYISQGQVGYMGIDEARSLVFLELLVTLESVSEIIDFFLSKWCPSELFNLFAGTV